MEPLLRNGRRSSGVQLEKVGLGLRQGPWGGSRVTREYCRTRGQGPQQPHSEGDRAWGGASPLGGA